MAGKFTETTKQWMTLTEEIKDPEEERDSTLFDNKDLLKHLRITQVRNSKKEGG